ncbi:hypothetical protein DX130_07065 [Paenibacillus paeoniae]|uniref:Uncharacterized protein n=1 Tax=Paenibacillus paeoniae TaxID=2292705 RepID=A0A371PLY7_9BACL|nr:hypothetical protein DX130_07065 [Paenibacillus paeoniae]
MISSVILFSSVVLIITALQFRFIFKKKKRRDAWVFLGWMMIVWAAGLLFILGMKFPVPERALFPLWGK